MSISTDAAETVEFLGALKYNQLRALAKSRGLNSKGKKADLITRLRANNADDEASVPIDAESTVNMDPVDTKNHCENTTARRPARSTPETCECHERDSETAGSSQWRDMQSKVDTVNLLQHATAPAGANSTPAATSKQHERECFAPQVEISEEKVARPSATVPTRSVVIVDTASKKPHLDIGPCGVTPSRAKPPALVTKSFKLESTQKLQKATPSSRFARAHQNLFAGQRSIEAYGRTPNKSGVVKENIPRSRAASNKIDVSKPIARKLASTCAYGVGSSSGSGVVTQAKVGKTVASKPCTLVIQPSTKKPTQVKAFSLSSAKGKREGFTFKPYSGRVQPVTPVVGALADRTANTNVPTTASFKGKVNPRDRAGVKATLASGKAQVQRRAKRFTAGKAQRENKFAERRTGAA